MDLEEIRKLACLMDEAGLVELEVEDHSGRVRLVRGGAGRPGPAAGASPAVEDPLAGREPGAPQATSPGASARRSGAEIDHLPPGMAAITSPMVGTFYRAAAPDAAPFVVPGDVVQAGQVVCIIEAMKMMNEIHAETAARIVSVQAENGAPVEYGSPLFLIELLE